MKFIDSNFEIMEQQPGMDGLFKHIEKVSRTCYKSEDKITEDSAKIMINALVKNMHTAMLEHGTIYLYREFDHKDNSIETQRWKFRYKVNPYSKQVMICDNKKDACYITTNYRVIIENGWEDDLQYMCEPTECHKRRYTVKFITSIGIGREIARHRAMSFAQESSRYCNYSKGKFNKELTFIIPQWIYDCQADEASYVDSLTGDPMNWLLDLHGEQLVNQLTCEDRAAAAWVENLERCEQDYMYLLSGMDGYQLKPEEARGILPMDTKSEIVVTGFKEDWIHFFNLRSYIAMTGKPHPDIMKLANELLLEFEKRKYIDHEELYNKTELEN